MTARRTLPQPFLELPFSRRAAVADGVPDDRLAASDLVRPFYGVHVAANLPDCLAWRCRAYQERMNPAHCFSHQTAAELYGLPLPLYATTRDLQISAPAPLRPPETRGTRGHSVVNDLLNVSEVVLRDIELGELFAFPVVSPELLWAQLATVLDADDLVALGDAIVTELPRPGLLTDSALATIGDLEAAMRSHAGRRGAKAMMAALGSIRTGPLSRTESLLRLILLRAGFPEPLLNVDVLDGDGRVVAIPDLSWPDAKLVVEYEGDYHRRSRTKFRSDITRGERYADAGWFQLRAHAEDVFGDPDPFCGRLLRRMVDRGWRPPFRELRQVRGARH